MKMRLTLFLAKPSRFQAACSMRDERGENNQIRIYCCLQKGVVREPSSASYLPLAVFFDELGSVFFVFGPIAIGDGKFHLGIVARDLLILDVY